MIRRVRPLLALCLALGAAGCGGGLYIGFGDDPFDDPPSVSLVASVASAVPGQAIRLGAAASDDRGVLQVSFYRLDAGGETLLGNDTREPFEVETVVPAAARGSVSYRARASDTVGQTADSNVVTVTLP